MVGLVGGWARSRYPVFGAIPEPAQRLLMDIGLIVFIAVVGMHAGPHAVEAFQSSGGALLRQDLRGRHDRDGRPARGGHARRAIRAEDEPADDRSAASPARRPARPGLNALREASGSNVGSLAYTVPYAIGNIVLTIWGPVVVAIVHAMRGTP